MTFQFSLLLWLFVKHFIADFPLQATPWMYQNKGSFTSGFLPIPHPGGLVHAGIHAIGTSFVVAGCLAYYGYPKELILGIAQSAAFIDFIIHFCVDFAKVNITKYYGLLPNGPTRLKGEMFWILLGLDQLLHAMTYFYIVHSMPIVEMLCRRF